MDRREMIKRSIFGVSVLGVGSVAYEDRPGVTSAEVERKSDMPRLRCYAVSDMDVVRLMRGRSVQLTCDAPLPVDAQFRGFRPSTGQMVSYVAVFEHPSFDPVENYDVLWTEVCYESF